MKIEDLLMPTLLGSIGTTDRIFLKTFEECDKGSFADKFTYPTDYAILCGLIMRAEGNGMVGSCTMLCQNTPTGNLDKGLSCCFGADCNTNWPYIVDKLQGVKPSMHLRLDTFDTKLFPITTSNINGREGHFLTLGQFPQSYVGDEMNELFEKRIDQMLETGKTYVGYYKQGDFDFDVNKEYEYLGSKFVRLHAHRSYDKTTLSNGEIAPDGKYVWCKVEPIAWRITNWSQLPKSINPQGNGNAVSINLESEYAVAAMPFYFASKNYSLNENGGLWQNSIPRGYLNGLNLCAESTFVGNGDPSRMAKNSRNFSKGNSFLEEAFDQLEMSNAEVNQALKKMKSKSYEIISAPMSVKDQMQFYIDNGMSFMLHGPSGVGKTRRVQEIDPECVMLQLRDGILPEEIIGKTGYEKGKSFWIEPTWYTRICQVCKEQPDKNHVLFIDEITNVHANEQSLVFHIVLEHSIDGNIGKLPKNCVVVAAGNNPEESEAAYNMPEPLFRRFEGHIYLQPDVKSFLEWGSELRKDGRTKLHPLVSAFVAAHGEKAFYSKYDPDKPPKFAIDPRGWEQVSDIIYNNKNRIAYSLIANKIGADNAMSFISFAKKPPISLEDVLNDDYILNDIPRTMTSKYALMLSLRMATVEQVDKVREFVKSRLGDEYLSMFDSLWAQVSEENALYLGEKEKNDIGNDPRYY